MPGRASRDSSSRLAASAGRRGGFSALRTEPLETRRLLSTGPIITEFMARNQGMLEDGDGSAPDWLEVYNSGDAAVDLAGYRLTDRPDDLGRWVFPSINLDPGQYLVIFASGQDSDDYVDAAGNLHANFALSGDGEYLAMVDPGGTIVSEFGSAAEPYPPQLPNVSYGVAQRQALVTARSDSVYFVPVTDTVDDVWAEASFDAASRGFAVGKASLGYETSPDSRTSFAAEIVTELPPRTHAVYARIEFPVDDASAVSDLVLRLKYDDAFVAYLNGLKVAEENAPSNPTWFSAANRSRRDAEALQFADFSLTDHLGVLVDGTNVLALHGLNNLGDEDMLLVPELIAVVNDDSAKVGYMASATPGGPNVSDREVASGFVAPPRASVDRGFYEERFDVTMETDTPGAVIRYTTDGSLLCGSRDHRDHHDAANRSVQRRLPADRANDAHLCLRPGCDPTAGRSGGLPFRLGWKERSPHSRRLQNGPGSGQRSGLLGRNRRRFAQYSYDVAGDGSGGLVWVRTRHLHQLGAAGKL
jgi:hypothetical protein